MKENCWFLTLHGNPFNQESSEKKKSQEERNNLKEPRIVNENKDKIHENIFGRANKSQETKIQD